MERHDGNNEYFHVGEIRVEPQLNRIVKSGEICKLEPKVMQLLVHLATLAGRVVTRDELMATVWTDVIVSDKAMVHAISALRKALGDDWTQPRYIETISKNGYRLIAPVRKADTTLATPDTPQVARNSAVGAGERSDNGATRRLRAKRQTATMSLTALALLALAGTWFVRRSGAPPVVPLYGLPATSLTGSQTGGVISPDGQKLAFAWKPGGSDNWDIYIKLVDGENVVRLTEDPARDDHPVWSPDAQYVAFTRRSTDHCKIYRVSVLGGPPVQLGACTLPPLSNLSWSPDGKWIARSDAPSRQDARRVLLLDVESGELVPLTQPPNGSRDTDPVFSPDGRTVAFVRASSNGLSDLFWISIASGQVERITFDRRPIFGLDWMPSGRDLVFATDREGRVAFWRVPMAGGKISVFPVADQQIIRPSLARSTHALVYTKYTDNTNIWSLTRRDDGSMDGEATVVISSSKEDYYPQVSPNGDRLAFVSGRTGYSELWTSDLDGTNLIRHTQFEGAFVASPSWSPDGRTLLFDARIDGQAALYTVGARERVPVRLSEDSWDELNGSWSRDGDSVYFASNRSGSWQIWKRPIQGGRAVQMTQRGGIRGIEGVDPSTLYFTKPDTLGVWQNSGPLAAESCVIADLWISDSSNWALTDEGILFVRNDPRSLAYFDFATGSTRPLYDDSRRIPLADSSSLSICEDNRTLFYTQIDGGGLDLMVVKEY